MKKLKIVGIVLAVIVLVFIFFLGYMGFFSKVAIIEKEMGPYTIAYEKFVGPYTQSGKVFEKVYKALEKDGIKASGGLGIYYDNPARVKAEKLRSDCGVVIDKKDKAAFSKVKGLYKTKIVKKEKYIVATYPLKNMLSYMFGPMKVYPAIAKYAKAKGYKESDLGIEVYDEQNKKIFFLMNIAK